MANPIKSSDLYKDDGALEKAVRDLKAISTALEELKGSAAKMIIEVKKQNAATKDGQKAIAESAKKASLLEREQQKLIDAYGETNKEVQRLRAERTKANRLAKAEAKLADSAADSYDALSAQYTINKAKLNAMNKEQRAAAEASEGLVTKTKDIFEEMKRLQAQTGKTALNVGNYKEGVKEAIQETFGLEKAFSILAKTPLLAVIGLVVGAFGALFQAFQRSERGAELMARASGVVQGVMSVLVGITNNLVDNIIAVWEDPLGSLENFGKALVDNVVNRFKGLIDLGGVLGKAIKALFSRDLKGLQEAAKEAGTALVQMGTGLDAEQQEEYADAVKKTKEEIEAQTAAFDKLVLARREITRQNRELTKQAERTATVEQLAQVIADDATRSFKEREESAERAREALEKRASVELQLARNNLSLIEQEIALRRRQGEDVEGLLDQQLGAYSALLAAEREYTVTVADNEKTRRELVQDRLERDLDILIDGFDNQKTINERIIASEEEALSYRRELLAETQKLSDDSFNKQIETIQKFTGIRVDANALIGESDAVVLNERIRQLGLSEIIEGRLLEVIRDRKTAIQDLKEAQQELTQSSAIEGLQQIKLFQAVESQRREEVEKSAIIVKNIVNSINEQAQRPGSIFDLLGFNFDAEDEKAIESSFGFAKQQLADYQAKQVEFSRARAQAAKEDVKTAQDRLNAELRAAELGYASRVDLARKDLELAEKNQADAEKRQEKAQKAQLLAQSVQQATNLVTAISKLWVEPGWPLALPLTAVLFSSFAAAKVKALQATKIFRHGGYEVLEGGSHTSGNDVPLFTGKDGVQRRAEGGEGMAIFSRKATAQYGSALPAIVDAINAGTLADNAMRQASIAHHLPPVRNTVNVDNSEMEKRLKSIEKLLDRQTYFDSNGNRVERKGNKTTVYLKGK